MSNECGPRRQSSNKMSCTKNKNKINTKLTNQSTSAIIQFSLVPNINSSRSVYVHIHMIVKTDFQYCLTSVEQHQRLHKFWLLQRGVVLQTEVIFNGQCVVQGRYFCGSREVAARQRCRSRRLDSILNKNKTYQGVGQAKDYDVSSFLSGVSRPTCGTRLDVLEVLQWQESLVSLK